MKFSHLLVFIFLCVTQVKAITVFDIISNSNNHNTLELAIRNAGLEGALNGPGPLTVFAPTDAAFAALPAGTVEALLQNPTGALKNILLYHVVGAKALSTSLSNNQEIVTLYNGKKIKVTINNDGVFINNAKVTVADINADNGVVHVIDAVILPSNTVADVIINSPNHTTLEAAATAAGLVDALNGPGPLTVFAPTDAAFAALPAGTVEALLQDPTGALKNILLYHVVGAKALSTSLSNNQEIVTLYNGKKIKVTINNRGVFINNAQVIVADINADNGVVHVIDAVLLPSNTIADVIINSPIHNTLETAIRAAGLVDALNGPGPLTVFAPTDAAFAALPAGTVEALLQDPSGALTQILTYHAVSGKLNSTNLTNNQTLVTLSNGRILKVTINNEGVFINKAKVIVADINTDNGVVHVIDAVLTELTNSVSDVNSTSKFNVWPNPFLNTIQYKIDNESSNNVLISIFDINGKRVYFDNTKGKEGNVILDVEKGIYLMEIIQDQKRFVNRISKAE